MIDLHIRVPKPLAEKLKAQAKADARSVAAEIVYLLGKAMK